MFDLFSWMEKRGIKRIFKTELPRLVDNEGLLEVNRFLRTIEHKEILFSRVGHLRSIIAVHSALLGPATGGIRVYAYESFERSLFDAIRLSRGMTYKAAGAGLLYGGGKTVIKCEPENKTEKLLLQFGEELKYFNFTRNIRYFAGEDSGISVEDIEILAKICPDCLAGRSENAILANGKRGSGDPSIMTAFGCVKGIEACLDLLEIRFEDATILVHGIGKVGFELCRRLKEERKVKKLLVSDISEPAIKRCIAKFGLNSEEIVPVDKVFDTPCDIYCPCLTGGGILNKDTIPRLKCKAVAGATNNQLADEESNGHLLFLRNILYAPDYIINAGGLINITDELNLDGYSRKRAFEKVVEIYDRIFEILYLSSKLKKPTNEIADGLAESRLKAAEIAKVKKR